MPTTSAIARKEVVPAAALEVQRLDWLKAAIIGLTDRETAILRVIADVDGQSANHMRSVLATQVPAHSASMTFLRLWNEEEFSNCQDMAKLMAACGVDLQDQSESSQTPHRRLAHWLSLQLRRGLGRLVPNTAGALQLTWATSQKLMLTLAYEQLALTTTNPILRVLAHRIAKQERRNFFWYFNGARALLRHSRVRSSVVRLLMERLWFPLSEMTQSRQRAQALLEQLWTGHALADALTRLDEAMAQLPGLANIAFAEGRRSAVVNDRPQLATQRA